MKLIKLIDLTKYITGLLLLTAPFCATAQKDVLKLELEKSTEHDLTIHKNDQTDWQIETKGKAPYIFTQPLQTSRNKDLVVLSFEYFCPKGLDKFQIFFGPDIKESYSKIIRTIGVAEGWVTFSIDLTDDLRNWGKAGDQLRFDFGSRPNVQFQIRNIIFRKPMKREREFASERRKKDMRDAEMEFNLKKYLSTQYASQITNVKVNENDIVISGKTSLTKGVSLGEITPYQDVTEQTNFSESIPLLSNSFEVKVKRYTEKDGFNYDRLL